MKANLHILFSSNHAYAESLLAAIKSLLTTCNRREDLIIHVIDRGLPERAHFLLQAYEWKYHTSISVYPYRSELLSEYQIPASFDELTSFGHYDRLLAPYLIDVNRCLYLDCDMLIQSDLFKLAETELGGASVGAVQDHFIQSVDGPSGIFDWEERDMISDSPYFNSGLLLMDLDRWRTEGIADQCIEFAREFEASHQAPPPLFDQYVLNVLFYNQWKQLPLEWNRFADLISLDESEPKLVHFAGVKKAFSSSRESNQSFRFFSRVCQRLIREDWDDASTISERSLTLEKVCRPQPHLTTTHGNAIVPAAPSALAKTPDAGEIFIIIPIMILDENSIRFANFRFLLQLYAQSELSIIVVEQVVPSSTDAVETEIKRLSSSRVFYVSYVSEDTKIRKSTLINKGVEFACSRAHVKYLWQIDADILVHPEAIIHQLNALNSSSIPVVRPLLWFIRLGEERSERVRQFEPADFDHFDPNEESTADCQVVDIFGAGTIIFSPSAFEEVGGYNEDFVGWGWEDVDFARRLGAKFDVHTLPLTGTHLFHENDRAMTPMNFDRYVTSNNVYQRKADIDRELRYTQFVNVMELFCVIHPQRISIESEALDSPLLFNQTPIVREYLPREKGYARSHMEQLVYSLTQNSPRIGGFSWSLGMEVNGPANSKAMDPAELIDEMVSYSFRFLLIEPDPEKDTLRDRIVFGQVCKMLENACRNHMVPYKTVVKIVPSSSATEKQFRSHEAYQTLFGREVEGISATAGI